MKYQLYTTQQQCYFFSFIVSITAAIKYIDIEFASQPVLLPRFVDVPANDDIVGDLINAADVLQEQQVYSAFRGSLIPPTTAATSVSRAVKNVTMTKTLKKFVVSQTSSFNGEPAKDDHCYLQDEQLSSRSLHT